jgi:hypothetical protein
MMFSDRLEKWSGCQATYRNSNGINTMGLHLFDVCLIEP